MAKSNGLFGDGLSVLIGWVVGILVVFALLKVVTAQEDDPWYNCYLSGNMSPGPLCPWHGFVNEFENVADR
jgi:hypothetical protein